ncbi:beta-ribofuranosylaminobenzene 5'-phosphate synthase family protein [Spirillospora sp. CA-294931]|uniref:beta-ribofuranosylaminobenzene 5'-phosphate synthase family protein n=1 Tax=Spirillospora sp. CA-294931 TaxID=3240042 RepID=UPI003D8A9509
MADAYRITGFPRLHLGLIDLSEATRRAYGGAGMAVDGLPTVLTVRDAAGTEIGSPGLSSSARTAIEKALDAAGRAGWDVRCRIDVHEAPPDHVGLGSTTTAVLCALRGLAAIRGYAPRDAELQRLSGRGRTSGAGVNTFFSGGLGVDVGQPREPGRHAYLPSSANPRPAPSRKLLALPLPDDWRVSLLLHDGAPTVHGAREVAFFRRNTPVSPDDTLAMIAELYHGLLPAVLETDLPLFSAALREFQGRGFKRAEIAGQPAPVRDLLAELRRDPGIACGLSSMGPMLFAIHEKGAFEPAEGVRVFGPFPFRNEGHECVPL